MFKIVIHIYYNIDYHKSLDQETGVNAKSIYIINH